MFSKAKKNYCLNVILLVLGIACSITGIVLDVKPDILMPFFKLIHFRELHKWSGYILIVLVMVHLFWHLDWIKFMTKVLRKSYSRKSDNV